MRPTLRPINPNCDGSGPCSRPQVRVLPLGGDANLILCRSCHGQELAYREDRNRELAESCRFDLPTWDSLRVYGEEA